MAKKSGHNNKLFIIVIILLLILTSLGIGSYFYFNQKLEDSKRLNDEDYKNIKINLETIEKELKDIEKEIDSLSNLSSKKESLRKEYFAKIKTLEDEILAGKSNKKIAYLTFDDGPY